MKTYRVWTLDLIGNEQGGWDVNDRREAIKAMPVPGDQSDENIIRALVKAKLLKPAALKKGAVKIDGEEDMFYIEDVQEDQPILQLELNENKNPHGNPQDGNLPTWVGAGAVYAKAYRILENMGRRGHSRPAQYSREGKMIRQGAVTEDMKNLIDALNEGNEEKIKGLLMLPFYSDYNKNPLTPYERRLIEREAASHERDSREHRTCKLRTFDAGTAAGMREAAAIAGGRSRRNPLRGGGSNYIFLKKGTRVHVSARNTAPGKGLSHPKFDGRLLEDARTGTWDVFDVLNDKGETVSVYGFSLWIGRDNPYEHEHRLRSNVALWRKVKDLLFPKTYYDKTADYQYGLVKGMNPKRLSQSDEDTLKDLLEMHGHKNPAERYLGPLKNAETARKWALSLRKMHAQSGDIAYRDAAALLERGWQAVASRPELAQRIFKLVLATVVLKRDNPGEGWRPLQFKKSRGVPRNESRESQLVRHIKRMTDFIDGGHMLDVPSGIKQRAKLIAELEAIRHKNPLSPRGQKFVGDTHALIARVRAIRAAEKRRRTARRRR